VAGLSVSGVPVEIPDRADPEHRTQRGTATLVCWMQKWRHSELRASVTLQFFREREQGLKVERTYMIMLPVIARPSLYLLFTYKCIPLRYRKGLCNRTPNEYFSGSSNHTSVSFILFHSRVCFPSFFPSPSVQDYWVFLNRSVWWQNVVRFRRKKAPKN
jgi:hypothetical protein